MASIDQSTGVNGYNGQSYSEQSYQANDYSSAPAHAPQDSQSSNSEIPKDEVGWYFVEQYYTTLSKSPEKLFLFYNKRSQYVSGTETEKVMTCVGQKAIHDRITALGIQDCKVRVTNVDSQGSGANIVIQVIGEISNQGNPTRKFVQTFVLAEQTNGYFVLNDIFRYISEDEDEEPEADQATDEQQPVAQAAAENSVLPAIGDATAMDQVSDKLQETANSTLEEDVPAPAGAVNGEVAVSTEDAVVAEDAPVAANAPEQEETAASAEKIAEQVIAEDVAQPDKPAEPEPSPVVAPAKQPAAPAKSAAPTSWATLVAGSRVALPSSVSSNASPAPAQTKAKAPAPVVPTAPAAANATAPDVEPPGTPVSSGSEWQTAQRDGHARKQSRAQPVAQAVPAENSRGYIKNVQAEVSEDALKSKLESIAKVVYFDINRAKVGHCPKTNVARPPTNDRLRTVLLLTSPTPLATRLRLRPIPFKSARTASSSRSAASRPEWPGDTVSEAGIRTDLAAESALLLRAAAGSSVVTEVVAASMLAVAAAVEHLEAVVARPLLLERVRQRQGSSLTRSTPSRPPCMAMMSGRTPHGPSKKSALASDGYKSHGFRFTRLSLTPPSPLSWVAFIEKHSMATLSYHRCTLQPRSGCIFPRYRPRRRPDTECGRGRGRGRSYGDDSTGNREENVEIKQRHTR